MIASTSPPDPGLSLLFVSVVVPVVLIDGRGENSSAVSRNPGWCCCRRKEFRIGLFISGSLLVGCPDQQRVLSSTMIGKAETTPEMLLLLSHGRASIRECLCWRALNPSQEASGLGDPSRRPGTSIGCNRMTPKAEEEAAGKVNQHPPKQRLDDMRAHRFRKIPPGSRRSRGIPGESRAWFL